MCGNENLKEPELLLTAFGNANVDIIIKLQDCSLFEKYDLPFDRAKSVDDEFLKTIEQDFRKQNSEIQCSPGGCSHNTLRIFQWLMNTKFNSNIIGSIGMDENGTFLKNELDKNGVLTSYTLKKDFRTAFVFIFIYKNYITPVYGTVSVASWHYSLSDLLADEIALDSIKKSKIVLLEGFFVVHSHDVGLEAIKICTELNIPTSFNICGEYLVESHPDIVILYLKSCNIVIGNRVEFKAACHLLNVSVHDFEKSLIEVFKIMIEQNVSVNYKIKSMEKHKKILIVTDGSKPVYCVSANINVIKYEVSIVEKHMVKDVIGAGDSFLAGFLFGIIHDFPILKCLELASKVAAEIVQHHGCIAPEKSSSTLLATLA